MRTTGFVFLATSLLMGCGNEQAAPQCGPNQEVIDLDGEKLCADEVHDMWGGGSTVWHLTSGSQFTGNADPNSNKCGTTASNHCSNHPGGWTYDQGTMTSASSYCRYQCLD